MSRSKDAYLQQPDADAPVFVDRLDAFHRTLRACADLRDLNTACSISSADTATASGRRRFHAKVRGGFLGQTTLLSEGATEAECISFLARQAKQARLDYEQTLVETDQLHAKYLSVPAAA